MKLRLQCTSTTTRSIEGNLATVALVKSAKSPSLCVGLRRWINHLAVFHVYGRNQSCRAASFVLELLTMVPAL
jgi:hypothetical protein